MKNSFYKLLIIILLFSACSKSQDKTEFISFLETNYAFNENLLNQYKLKYDLKNEEQPESVSEQVNDLYSEYLNLNSSIEKEANFELVIKDYNDFIKKFKSYTNFNKYNFNIESSDTKRDNQVSLNILKNKLVIAMSETFEYGFRDRVSVDRLRRIDSFNTDIISKTNKSISLILSYDFDKERNSKKEVVINQFNNNGVSILPNFNFIEKSYVGQINLDSLKKGNHKIQGFIRHYTRTSKIDVPFSKTFKIE